MSERTHLRLLLAGPAAILFDSLQLPDTIMAPRRSPVSCGAGPDLACDIGNAQAIFKMTAA